MTKYTGVSYDPDIEVLAFNLSAWNATAPVQWFNKYKIISLVNNPLTKTLNILDLKKYYQSGEILPKTNKEVRTSKQAAQLIRDEGLEEYGHIYNYSLPAGSDSEALTNDSAIAAKFENKVWLRETFGDRLRFPSFSITTYGDLCQAKVEGFYKKLGAMSLVIQHPTQSGGRGTYYVDGQEALTSCVAALSESLQLTDKLVVSKALSDPRERTVQACVANDSVFVGPAQAQLVGHPLLVSTRRGDIQFCGGRIDSGLLSNAQYAQAADAARIVGDRLKSEGYRGIFGMDFLISEDELYVLEVNPRLTGLTTLLAFIQREVPFLLLHILEHAKSPYRIEVEEVSIDSGSYVQVYAKESGINTFVTGQYNSTGERMSDGFETGSILPESTDEFFVGMRVSPGDTVSQGKSLAFVYSKRQLFDDEGAIDPAVVPLIEKIRQ